LRAKEEAEEWARLKQEKLDKLMNSPYAVSSDTYT